MVTINKLIMLFNDLAKSHLMIKDSGYGPLDRIDDVKYPLVWTDIQTGSLELNERNLTGTYTIDLYCFDRLDKDQNNLKDIISDTSFILDGIVAKFSQSALYRENFVKINGTINKNLVQQVNSDDTFGWNATFEVTFPVPLNECNSPFEECLDC
jgi:hypothetical protein